MEKRLKNEWTVAAFDREANEWTHTTNQSYEITPDYDPELFVRQAPPIKVSPSRRKREKHDGERLIGVGDIHFPFHNQKRVTAMLAGLRERSPDTIVLMGDNLDNAPFSRFESMPEWAGSTQKGIDQFAEYLGQLRADHPKTRIIWHEGNHDQRIANQIRNYNGDLSGLKRAGEKLSALSLDFLLRCGELDVEFIDGYPSSYESHRGVLETLHGSRTSSTGIAVGRLLANSTVSIMTGHTHQLGIVSRTFNDRGVERTIYGAEAGTYADVSQIPSQRYAKGQTQRQNWQSGLVEWTLTNTEAVPQMFPIDDTGIYVNGKRYKS